MLGKTVQKVRKEKGFTKKEIYSGVISQTFSYYFEKGENSITVEKLQKILKNLNVSFEEFFLIHNDFQFSPYDQIYKDISVALNTNVLDLKKIYKENTQSSDMNKKLSRR